MNLRNEFTEIWKKYNPATDEHGKFLLSTFMDYRKGAHKQFLRSYYIILILGSIYYCLDSHIVTDLTVFSIKINNIVLVKWGILPILSFIFYQGITSLMGASKGSLFAKKTLNLLRGSPFGKT
jgi:hypothetical protein